MKNYLGEDWLIQFHSSWNVVHHSEQGMVVDADPGQNHERIRQLLIMVLTRKPRTRLDLGPSYTGCRSSPTVSSVIPVLGSRMLSLTLSGQQGFTWCIDTRTGKTFMYLKKILLKKWNHWTIHCWVSMIFSCDLEAGRSYRWLLPPGNIITGDHTVYH